MWTYLNWIEENLTHSLSLSVSRTISLVLSFTLLSLNRIFSELFGTFHYIQYANNNSRCKEHTNTQTYTKWLDTYLHRTYFAGSFRYLLQPESYALYNIIVQRLCVILTLWAVSNLFSALVIPTGIVDPICIERT